MYGIIRVSQFYLHKNIITLNNMSKGIYQHKHLSEVTKQKMSLAHKGKKLSEEHKKKLSNIAKKRGCQVAGWNKGLVSHFKGIKRPPFSEEWKKKMSLAKKGKKGHPHTEESKKKMSEAHKGDKNPNFGKISFWRGKKRPDISGEKSGQWKGGITSINIAIRGSLQYKVWEYSILIKDRHICQKCGETSVRYLVAHHILNFAQYPELRFAIDNGITFCRPCHKKFHHIYGKKNNNIEQIKEFLN
jgi:hypothetical protein